MRFFFVTCSCCILLFFTHNFNSENKYGRKTYYQCLSNFRFECSRANLIWMSVLDLVLYFLYFRLLFILVMILKFLSLCFRFILFFQICRPRFSAKVLKEPEKKDFCRRIFFSMIVHIFEMVIDQNLIYVIVIIYSLVIIEVLSCWFLMIELQILIFLFLLIYSTKNLKAY